MPGIVEKILVTQEQQVIAGETLVTISAMKMEVKVTAPVSGKIGALVVSVGARVVEGALILRMISSD